MAQNGGEQERGDVVKIELIGGPRCGEVRDVVYADPTVVFGEGAARSVYRRRDRPMTPDTGVVYVSGESGRKYDYAYPGGA